MEDSYKGNELIIVNDLKQNKEALELRKIFNLIEENQRINKKEIKTNKIFNDKVTINTNFNILNIISDMNNRPKNKYKYKLQKILRPKKETN